MLAMISRLSIQGLAIIDCLSIDFSPGFNVITGETGAGKSILIRALNFVTGGRANAETVRKNAPHAIVSAEFLVPKTHPALGLCEALGISCEPMGKKFGILIRRQLSAKGRSQCWVNDVSVTTQSLKSLGPTLIDVFAQHETQKLMDESRHGVYIDSFVSVKAAKKAVKDLYEICDRLVEQADSLLKHFYSAQDNRDFVEFRLEELKKFGPTKEDYEETVSLCEQAGGSHKVRSVLGGAVEALDGKGTSLTERLSSAVKCLENLPDRESFKSLIELRERLQNAHTELEDITFELRQGFSQVDFDEETLERAQSRLYGYQKLFRKHLVEGIDALIETRADLESAMDSMEVTAERLGDVFAELEEAIQKTKKESLKLSGERKKVAAFIKKSVEKELSELAMKGAKFETKFSPVERMVPDFDLKEFERKLQEKWISLRKSLSELGPDGMETVEFLLAANPGEGLLPLAKVASGGEVSRIMLALKKALTVDADTCVLVFDEIDTGISGRVADIVGRKMRELAANFQVLCISHLPQVAVYADSHFLVKKMGKNQRTQASIVALSADKSAEEIARLLSGEELSKPSLANAKALIAKAKKSTNQRPQSQL